MLGWRITMNRRIHSPAVLSEIRAKLDKETEELKDKEVIKKKEKLSTLDFITKLINKKLKLY